MRDEQHVKEEDLALLSAFEAGELADDDRRRAEALLETSAEAQAALGRLRALRAAVADLGAPTLSDVARERIAMRVLAQLPAVPSAGARSRGRRAVATGLAAAAAVLIVVGVGRLLRTAVAPATVAPTGPTVARVLRTGPGGFQLVPIGERAVAFVGEETEIEIAPPGAAGPAVRVRRGAARLVVRKSHGEPFVVATPAADVAVMGTEFDVDVDGDAVVVRVVRGEVEVRNALGRRRLWKGESARAHVSSAPRLVEAMKAVVLDGPAEIESPPAR